MSPKILTFKSPTYNRQFFWGGEQSYIKPALHLQNEGYNLNMQFLSFQTFQYKSFSQDKASNWDNDHYRTIS